MASPVADMKADPQTPEYWKGQIEAAKQKRDPLVEGWKTNIQRYLAKTLGDAPKDHTVVVPLDFSNVEQKKAQLFFRVPQVQLEAKKPQFQPAVSVFQAVVNHFLGRHGVDAKTMMDEVLFDALCPSGLAVTKIGYEPTIAGVKPALDAQGVPMLGPDGQPQTVPNVIHEAYYWNRVSPEKVLIPADFHGSNYDRAPWLGFEFEMDFEVAKRQFNLPEDFNKATDRPQSGLNESEQVPAEGQRKRVTGQELWYRCHLVDPAVPHPERIGRLVLIDGLEGYAVPPTPTNWQREAPDGSLVGITGYPVHIKAVRYVSDTAYPPSDVTMGRPQVEEISQGRSQMIQQRERNVPMRWVNISGLGRIDGASVTQADIDKITKGQWQGIIPLNGPGQDLIGEMAAARFPRENFEFDRIAKQDLASVWAMGSNQRASDEDGPETATEASIIQAHSDTRLAYEQDGWLEWFVRGTEKLGGLIQVFADNQDFVPITGPDGVQQLVPWDRTTIAGEFVYSITPDTAIRQDAAAERKRATDTFQFLANNPHTNKLELTKWYARKQNLPDSLILPQPPEPRPEPPKVAFSLKGDDLNPLNPQFGIVTSILQQLGFQIDPLAVQQAQTMAATQLVQSAIAGQPQAGSSEHPGVAQPVSPLNKHHAEQTGNLPGGIGTQVQ